MATKKAKKTKKEPAKIIYTSVGSHTYNSQFYATVDEAFSEGENVVNVYQFVKQVAIAVKAEDIK